MGIDGKLSRHFWLTQGMARSVGINLNEALQSAVLRRDEYAQAIALCCDCGKTQQCVGWMAQQGAGARDVPSFCPIGEMLEKLRH